MAGAVMAAWVPSAGAARPGSPGKPQAFSFSAPRGPAPAVGPAGHGGAAGGAEFLEPAPRLVVDLERAGEREPALAGEERAEPEGVDGVDGDAGGVQGARGPVQQEVAH